MWWQTGPHLQRRRLLESGQSTNGGCIQRTSSSFFQKGTDIDELKDILKSKYGTLTRAWRVALDTDMSGGLDFREFSQALSSIGYIGNMRTLWFNLDDANTGSISLQDIDPDAYHALEKFRVLAGRAYGSVIECWHQLLDADKSGTVSFEEFHEAVQTIGYDDEEEGEQLFSYLLIKPGIRYITVHDLQFLQSWEETKQASAFRKRLPKGWVNKDPYMSTNPSKAGSSCGGGLTANPSMTTIGMSSTGQEASVEDWGNQIAWNEQKSQQAFRDFLVDKFGSLPEAFSAMDFNGSGALTISEFQITVAGSLRYCRPADASRLFVSFNADPNGTLTPDELGIPRNEWVSHQCARKQKLLVEKMNRLGGPGCKGVKLGKSPRQQKSREDHLTRIRNVTKRADVAFGMPLERGWGFPPDFSPRDRGIKLRLPPLSAR